MTSKTSKYGIKICLLLYTKTFYTLNLETSCKSAMMSFSCSVKPYDFVNKLVAHVSKSNPKSHWFIHYPFMLHLQQEHQLISTGTVYKNKAKISEKLLQVHNRETHSKTFRFQRVKTFTSHMTK